jgi:hypothetical protein
MPLALNGAVPFSTLFGTPSPDVATAVSHRGTANVGCEPGFQKNCRLCNAKTPLKEVHLLVSVCHYQKMRIRVSTSFATTKQSADLQLGLLWSNRVRRRTPHCLPESGPSGEVHEYLGVRAISSGESVQCLHCCKKHVGHETSQCLNTWAGSQVVLIIPFPWSSSVEGGASPLERRMTNPRQWLTEFALWRAARLGRIRDLLTSVSIPGFLCCRCRQIWRDNKLFLHAQEQYRRYCISGSPVCGSQGQLIR